MSNHIQHPYHLVDESPWPIFSALGGFSLTGGLLALFHRRDIILFTVACCIILIIITQWWRDVSHEGCFQGRHSCVVEIGLRWGMALFIVSEVFFFLSFFWAYFHSSLAPTADIGGMWPPIGVCPFNPFQVPLLNTIVLLSSGLSVTWAHHRLICGNHTQTFHRLVLTVILGGYFSALQGFEYLEASFAFSDGVYGSTFFLATGFHGLHVLVGMVFLSVCVIRHRYHAFRRRHHFGLEAAAWYWHFVDVVWLFLYIRIYWWGRA